MIASDRETVGSEFSLRASAPEAECVKEGGLPASLRGVRSSSTRISSELSN